MRRARSSPGAGAATVLRGVLAGTLLIGAIGSCELPKPQIPSIGAVPAPAAAAAARPAATHAVP